MLSAETTTASPIKFGYGPVLYKISLIDLGSFFFSFFLQVRAPAGDVGGGGALLSVSNNFCIFMVTSSVCEERNK